MRKVVPAMRVALELPADESAERVAMGLLDAARLPQSAPLSLDRLQQVLALTKTLSQKAAAKAVRLRDARAVDLRSGGEIRECASRAAFTRLRPCVFPDLERQSHRRAGTSTACTCLTALSSTSVTAWANSRQRTYRASARSLPRCTFCAARPPSPQPRSRPQTPTTVRRMGGRLAWPTIPLRRVLLEVALVAVRVSAPLTFPAVSRSPRRSRGRGSRARGARRAAA